LIALGSIFKILIVYSYLVSTSGSIAAVRY